jgi:hypothetical protein
MRLVVDWEAPDPAAVGARLADRLRLPRPDPDDDRFVLLLGGGAIRVMATGRGGRERLTGVSTARDARSESDEAGPGRAGGSSSGTSGPGARLLGVAWATVDLERGARELAARFDLEPGAFRSSVEDGWLGAAAKVARLGTTNLVVLEPVTEGRVAAALARFGEGPAGVYFGLPGPATGVVRAGPLGAGALLPGTPPWGPFAIVLALAAARATHPATSAAGTIGR